MAKREEKKDNKNNQDNKQCSHKNKQTSYEDITMVTKNVTFKRVQCSDCGDLISYDPA